MKSPASHRTETDSKTAHDAAMRHAQAAQKLFSDPSGTGLKSAMEAFQAAIPAMAMKNFLTSPGQANAQSSNT